MGVSLEGVNRHFSLPESSSMRTRLLEFTSTLKRRFAYREVDMSSDQHAKIALKTLRSHGRVLAKALDRQCDEYAQEVFGDVRFGHWLKVFTAYTGEFKEGWIPPDYFENIVVPRLKGHYRLTGRMSALNPFLLSEDLDLNLGCYAGGRFFNQRGELTSLLEFESHLRATAREVVFKLDNSSRGQGVFFLQTADIDLNRLKSHEMGLFQRRMVQHPILEQMCGRAVATLRITTVVELDGSVSCRNLQMKMGRLDETHVVEENIKISVDEKGRMGRESLNWRWDISTSHPDTGFVFEGVEIPGVARAVEKAISLHGNLRFVHAIGWDIGIDEKGDPQILELNTWNNGYKFGEAFDGPCFRGLGWEELWRV